MTIDRTNYQELLIEVKERIRSAQYAALKAVNHELIALYWDIGRLIVDRQQTAGWGKSVVEQLARDIQSEFPGISGFSVRNLWNMRNFHLTYSQDAKLQPLVAEIGWTHNLVILEKCKDDLEREFYLRMTRKFGWTKNVLMHQIENQTYQKTLLNQTNFARTLTTEFLPEYVGKMQFYLAVLDDTVRLPDENPAIGIILCKTKDRTIVEYALRESNKPIGVTTYQIVSTLPKEFQGQLPDPTQIAQLLAGINQS